MQYKRLWHILYKAKAEKIMYCERKFSLLYEYEYPFVGQIHMLFFLYEEDSMKPLLLWWVIHYGS